MNFDFSEDQLAARDQVRTILADLAPASVTRDMVEGRQAVASAAWAALGRLGYLGAAIPEQFGGSGLGPLYGCLIAEEIGRGLAALPYFSSLGLAAELIQAADDRDVHQALLPDMATGAAIVCVALDATIDATDGLTGEMAAVPDAAEAGHLLVAARPAGEGERSLFLVDLAEPGVTRDRLPSLDPSRPFARIGLDRVAGRRLSMRTGVEQAIARAEQRAGILLSFERIGLADRCIALACDYARDRQAFGRPIGSFQAIKHMLVDHHVANTLARGHAYYGAWALDASDDALPRAAAAALAASGPAVLSAAQDMVQVFGGIGITWEHDAHLHLRRARLLASLLGGNDRWIDLLVATLVDEQGDAA